MTKGIQTREVIIEKASELFNKYGYHGCSISDIMKATGLKKGGIYNHFANKDEIALASFDYSYQKTLERFRQRMDRCNNSSEKLLGIVEVFEMAVHDPVIAGGCPIMNTAMYATDSHPLLRARAIEALNLLHSYIKIKVEEGQKSGEFTLTEKSEQAASIIMSTLEGAVVFSRATSSDKYIKSAKNFIVAYIKNSLKQ